MYWVSGVYAAAERGFLLSVVEQGGPPRQHSSSVKRAVQKLEQATHDQQRMSDTLRHWLKKGSAPFLQCLFYVDQISWIFVFPSMYAFSIDYAECCSAGI
jgi:hypothetical protein